MKVADLFSQSDLFEAKIAAAGREKAKARGPGPGQVEKMLRGKAEASKIPYGILKQVFNRGAAAWRQHHRPGTNQIQWATARVNSFITGSGKARKADDDLWAKVKSK
jgi:hypothetical protein